MQQEIDQLRADQDVPIEELRRQYAGAAALSDDDGDGDGDIDGGLIGADGADSMEVEVQQCCAKSKNSCTSVVMHQLCCDDFNAFWTLFIGH